MASKENQSFFEIVSRENPTFKKLLKLKQKKYRREYSMCIAEGEKQVLDLINSKTANVEQIFTRKSVAPKYEQKLSSCENKLFILADNLFDLLTELETDQGILAVVRIPSELPITYPFLLLDRIADMGNMGTLLRTAAAFGFKTVMCLDCADAFNPKVLRSSMGTQFILNILTIQNLGNFKPETLIAADLKGESIPSVLSATKNLNGKFGIALGNEGNGISEQTKQVCTHFVTIPMNLGVESLNVAVAGGILMHALRG